MRIMRSVILHRVVGAPRNTSLSRVSNWDDQQSGVQAHSVPDASLISNWSTDSHDAQATRDSTSNHAIITGYLLNGLPYHLVVDCSLTPSRKLEIFAAIEAYLLPLMTICANDLAIGDDSESAIISDLTQLIDAYQQAHFSDCQFTLSVAIGYERDNELRLAGFHMGGTSFFIRRDTEVEILAAPSLAFTWPYPTQEKQQCDVVESAFFSTKMRPGDELVVCAGIPEEMLQMTLPSSENSQGTRSLNPVVLREPGTTLAAKLVASFKVHNQCFTKGFGDDFTVSYMYIPDASLQGFLQRKLALLFNTRLDAHEDDDAIYKQVEKNIRSFDFKGNAGVSDARDQFLTAVAKIKDAAPDKKPSAALLRTMVLVEYEMTHPGDVYVGAQIKQQARIAAGKKSLLWKALGGALMVLGVALIAVGCVGIAGSLGSGVGVLGVLPSAGIFGAGVGLFAAGSGMVRHGVVPSGLEETGMKLVSVNGNR